MWYSRCWSFAVHNHNHIFISLTSFLYCAARVRKRLGKGKLDEAARTSQKLRMLRKPEEPIDYRMLHADGNYTDVGKRSRRRVQMLDDALGKAHRRFKISDEEYHGLLRYRFHWRCGGLSGHIGSVDLNRIFAHDPAAMSGLAKTEKMADHRDAYHAAHDAIGRTPAWVADNVACYDFPLVEVGVMMGYRSEAHARARAAEVLSDAGYRLCRFWKDRDK